MEKRTLKFQFLYDMARFTSNLSTGYLMNTNNFTLTGKFSPAEIETAKANYGAEIIETTDKVFRYENL